MGQYILGIYFFFKKLVVEWNSAAVLFKVHFCCVENFGNVDFNILNSNENLEFHTFLEQEVMTALSEK